jgi:hypothetical protein
VLSDLLEDALNKLRRRRATVLLTRVSGGTPKQGPAPPLRYWPPVHSTIALPPSAANEAMAPRNEEEPRPSLFTRVSQASKRSFRSYSSSVEADDERSSTGDGSRSERDAGAMSPSFENGSSEERNAHGSYPGEDTRPTSRKELAGWYMYGFAAEVYVICGMYD